MQLNLQVDAVDSKYGGPCFPEWFPGFIQCMHPRIGAMFASGFTCELEAGGITRVCTEIWWNPSEEGEWLLLHQACTEAGDTAVTVTGVVNYPSRGFSLLQAPGVALCQPGGAAY